VQFQRVFAQQVKPARLYPRMCTPVVPNGVSAFENSGAKQFVQADRCDGLRYYQAVRGSGRLTQALAVARNMEGVA
jgi:hypothetical protein